MSRLAEAFAGVVGFFAVDEALRLCLVGLLLRGGTASEASSSWAFVVGASFSRASGGGPVSPKSVASPPCRSAVSWVAASLPAVFFSGGVGSGCTGCLLPGFAESQDGRLGELVGRPGVRLMGTVGLG